MDMKILEMFNWRFFKMLIVDVLGSYGFKKCKEIFCCSKSWKVAI